jgi:hypothetical protein
LIFRTVGAGGGGRTDTNIDCIGDLAKCDNSWDINPQKESLTTVAPPVVYFVRIGKFIKIGFTTNITERLKTFRGASAEPIYVLRIVPGGRDLERKLHQLFAENRINRNNEFFRYEYPLSEFIWMAKDKDIVTAFKYIEQLCQARARASSNVQRSVVERVGRQAAHRISKDVAKRNSVSPERLGRIIERRKTKAEEDAYYAKLVDERRQRLGW